MMTYLCNLADELGVTMCLQAEGQFGDRDTLFGKDLEKWYMKFGFQGSGVMHRSAKYKKRNVIMHQDIFNFINTLKRQIPDIIKVNPYFGVTLIANGIEFIGACRDRYKISAKGKSCSRFCRAINEYFPVSYHQFSRKKPYGKTETPKHDLYTSLRCGMAHILRPQGVFLTTRDEAFNDG